MGGCGSWDIALVIPTVPYIVFFYEFDIQSTVWSTCNLVFILIYKMFMGGRKLWML